MKQFSLRSSTYCPDFEQLPYDNGFNLHFYTEVHDGVLEPTHTWVFLAEIKENVTMDLGGLGLGIERPRYTCVDRSGNTFHVAFHLDKEDMFKFRVSNLKEKFVIGHTLAVLHGESHRFADGQVGLRLESLQNLRIIPCSLEGLLTAEDSLLESPETAAACSSCNEIGKDLKSCAKCKTKYCSKECQTKDWKSHKSICKALIQLSKWNGKDWSKYYGAMASMNILT